MAYAIMRAKKHNNMGTLSAALLHCYRDRVTPNAAAELTPNNQHMAAGSKAQAMAILRDRLPEKRRKDAVLAVEYLMTASPEWWETAEKHEKELFFQRSIQWLEQKYGAENVITATVHMDEKTPHLSAFVVPLTADNRLSAKEFIGNKAKMSEDQTTYAQCVADLGLKRGIEGSTAKHDRVKRFYGALNKPVELPQLGSIATAGLALGISSRRSDAFLEAIEDNFAKADVWDMQRGRVRQRERDLSRRENAVSEREAIADQQSNEIQALQKQLGRSMKAQEDLHLRYGREIRRLEEVAANEKRIHTAISEELYRALERARRAERELGDQGYSR